MLSYWLQKLIINRGPKSPASQTLQVSSSGNCTASCNTVRAETVGGVSATAAPVANGLSRDQSGDPGFTGCISPTPLDEDPVSGPRVTTPYVTGAFVNNIP